MPEIALHPEAWRHIAAAVVLLLLILALAQDYPRRD